MVFTLWDHIVKTEEEIKAVVILVISRGRIPHLSKGEIMRCNEAGLPIPQTGGKKRREKIREREKESGRKEGEERRRWKQRYRREEEKGREDKRGGGHI